MVKQFSSKVVDFDGPIKDDVVQELRRTFANLSESTKACYAPTGFTQAFQFERGEPVDVRKQQDTTEFFNILIDNVENCHPALKQLVN